MHVKFMKSIAKFVSVPRIKQPQQLTRPLLELLIRRIDNLCCPKTPCATKTDITIIKEG